MVPVQHYKHGVGSPPRGARSVVPAAAVTTHAKPHVQQQLARDLEVGRAALGQRCRPQSFGDVQQGNLQPRRWLDFWLTAALVLYSYTKSRVRACNLIPTYHTERESLSCCRPLISEGHPISMVCSRSGVRLYDATPRSGPGLPCAAARFMSAKKATMAARGCRAFIFLFF